MSRRRARAPRRYLVRGAVRQWWGEIGPGALPGRPAYRRRWQHEGVTALPDVVMLNGAIPGPARLLYAVLCAFAGRPDRTWRDMATMVDATGLLPEQVSGLLRVLERFRLVSLVRLADDDRHFGIVVEEVEDDTGVGRDDVWGTKPSVRPIFARDVPSGKPPSGGSIGAE